MSRLLPEPMQPPDAWVVVGIIHEAVQRFQRARDAKHFWRLVADNWRWVVPTERMAVLLWVQGHEYEVVQRSERGSLLGGTPERLDLANSRLGRLARRHRPTWQAIEEEPPQGSFETWLCGSDAGHLLATPLEVSGERVGVMLSALDRPDPLDSRNIIAAAATYGMHVAMTWRLTRLVEERLRTDELERMNAELHVARDRALSASRAKSTFLANMSHELRTPLNAIIGYSELLLEEPLIADHHEASDDVGRIRGAATHLLSLICDVLDLSKIEAGKLILDPRPVHVESLLQQLAATVKPMAQRNENRLLVRVQTGLPTLVTDPTRLGQIVLNLLSNSCKFTDGGLVELQVNLHAEEGIPGMLFRVRDSGLGMSADQLGRVFEPFEQAHRQVRHKVAGTGLGLAICRRLASLLGASLDLCSEVGVGTEARLWVPLQPETTRRAEAAAGGR